MAARGKAGDRGGRARAGQRPCDRNRQFVGARSPDARTVNTVCARVSGNETSAAGSGFFGIYLLQRTGVAHMGTAVKLEGLTGPVNAYLVAQNPTASSVGHMGTITPVSAGTCEIPS